MTTTAANQGRARHKHAAPIFSIHPYSYVDDVNRSWCNRKTYLRYAKQVDEIIESNASEMRSFQRLTPDFRPPRTHQTL